MAPYQLGKNHFLNNLTLLEMHWFVLNLGTLCVQQSPTSWDIQYYSTGLEIIGIESCLNHLDKMILIIQLPLHLFPQFQNVFLVQKWAVSQGKLTSWVFHQRQFSSACASVQYNKSHQYFLYGQVCRSVMGIAKQLILLPVWTFSGCTLYNRFPWMWCK